MTAQIISLEARRICKDDIVALLPVFLDDALDIITDQLAGASGQYNEQIALDDFQRGFDESVKLLRTAEYHLIFTEIHARHIAACRHAGALKAVGAGQCKILLIHTSGAAVGDRDTARNCCNRVGCTDGTAVAGMYDRIGLFQFSHRICLRFLHG